MEMKKKKKKRGVGCKKGGMLCPVHKYLCTILENTQDPIWYPMSWYRPPIYFRLFSYFWHISLGIYMGMGTYKVRNEIETKRNETKSTKTKRNEINETKRNETKPTKAKRNRLIWRKWKEKNKRQNEIKK